MKKILFCLLFVPFFVFCGSVKTGNWIVDINEDPITDEKTVRIFTIDKTKLNNETATFLFTCNSVSLLSFDINDLPKINERGNSTKVVLRVDKKTPIEMDWTKEKIGYEFSDINEINNLIKKGKKLVVRAEYSKTKDFEFSLAGFAKAFKKLQKNCSTN